MPMSLGMTRHKKTKTITEHMLDILAENGRNGIMWGDTDLLDYCAERSTHTNLMTKHPLDRHPAILTACERSGFFKKYYINLGGQHKRVRSLMLKAATKT